MLNKYIKRHVFESKGKLNGNEMRNKQRNVCKTPRGI